MVNTDDKSVIFHIRKVVGLPRIFFIPFFCLETAKFEIDEELQSPKAIIPYWITDSAIAKYVILIVCLINIVYLVLFLSSETNM